MEFDIIKSVRKIETRYKITFMSVFIMGLLSQGMGLFNKFSVHDDPTNYGVGATYTSGRWMLDVLARIEQLIYGDGHYSLPTFNGFLAIFFIGLSACLLINILDIKKEISCVFIGAIMVCFPVITSIFGYMFTLHFYMFAVFLGILGVYFICKAKMWYKGLLGILFLAASVGIYQAFVPTMITVMLFYLIGCTLNYKKISNLIKKILVVGISCGLFMGVYFIISKIYLKICNAELSNYKGIDSMGKSSLTEYISRAFDAYKEFFMPTASENYYMYLGNLLVLYRVVIILTIFMCIISFVKLFKSKKLNSIIFILLIICIPLSVNFIFVMAGREEIHSLMVYSQLLPFVFFVWMIENTTFDKMIVKKVISVVATIVMISSLVLYSRVDNKCYLKAVYAQQEAISYFTTLVTQIKETEGYSDELQIAFINEKNIMDKSLQSGDFGFMSDILYEPYKDVTEYVNDYTWINFMNQWTGYRPSVIDSTKYSNLEEVVDMPSYPDRGSIKVVDNVLIVKF